MELCPHNDLSSNLHKLFMKWCIKDNSILHIMIGQIQAQNVNSYLVPLVLFSVHFVSWPHKFLCFFTFIQKVHSLMMNNTCSQLHKSRHVNPNLCQEKTLRGLFWERNLFEEMRSMTGLCGQLWALSCRAPTIIYPHEILTLVGIHVYYISVVTDFYPVTNHLRHYHSGMTKW